MIVKRLPKRHATEWALARVCSARRCACNKTPKLSATACLVLQREKRHVFYTLVEEGLPPSFPKQTYTHGST
jgi:hypothetical protein